jgi:endonuclease YncB( thermonuclease family)
MKRNTNPFFGQSTLLTLLLTLSLFFLSCAAPSASEEDSFDPPNDATPAATESFTQTSQSSQVLQGKVVGVFDGDTIIVLDANNQTSKVRLKGIDAPEKSQAFGQQAKQNLSSLIFDQNVRVEWQERDRYQRIIGKVESGGLDICLKMIDAGYAWHYKRFQQSQSSSDRIGYAQAENRSRQQKIGLWQDPNPTPPWDYRSQTK